MNPSPDRGKECLPPKKRENRQGSIERQIPLDGFKLPVLLRSRSSAGGGEGARESSDRDRVLNDPNPHLLHTPPTLPDPAPGLPLPLPWHLSYSPSVSLPLFPGQISERRGSGSPAWRDDALSSPLTNHSRWLRGEGPFSLPPSPSSSPSSSFKTPFPANSREMWSCFAGGQRENSSPLYSPTYLFSHHSLYPQDPNLVDARYRYLSKKPNGLDGTGSRTASTSRPLLTGEYGNDRNRTRLDFSLHNAHANGGRKQQEDLTPHVHSGGTFLSDCQAQEDPEPHSSLQDRHLHGIVKTSSNLLSTSPHSLGVIPRPGRGGVLDPLGATTAEPQIYYSLGLVCNPSPQAQTYPLFSPSGTSLYNLHREQGPKQQNLRNSSQSPLSRLNSHDRPQRNRDIDQENDRDKVFQRDRERDRDKDKEKHLQHYKDQQRDSERRQTMERGKDLPPTHPQNSPPSLYPSPPALLPHFTKGSLIELASGQLKRVEELQTQDFLRSAATSPEVHLSTCTVLLISPSNAQGFSHLHVHLRDLNTQEILRVLVEYPFFVQDQGWSSCSPQRTSQLYGLPCRQLMEGDVCLALTPTPSQTHRTNTRTGSRLHRIQRPTRAAGRSNSSHREEMPPPPPPPPLPYHPPPTVPDPPGTLAAEPPVQEQQCPRKRRWSAPDTLSSTGTDAPSLLDLPHGYKLMKWQ
ncbi:ataxin-1-like [Brachionichthys hirsutus]|uniref:ataxin-1-like n=1 Tax=Brachionichthys hirsutus TaxID=412623 RepID=UPI003605165F